MRKSSGVLSTVVGAALALTALGCGKSDEAGQTTTLPQWPSGGLVRGDSVTGRMTQSNPVRATQYGTLTEVVDVASDGSQYRIDKYRLYPQSKILESSQWQSAAVVHELRFESRDALVAKCAQLGGHMLTLTLQSGRTMESCRVLSRWMNDGVSGAGETYLGPVPFGIVRRQWTSNDRTKKFSFEVVSYTDRGRTETL